jgi:hypothetical protein
MAIIYSNQKCKNPKRKPGWQQQQAEYEAWLKSMQSMPSGIAKPKSIVAIKPKSSPPRLLTNLSEGIHPVHIPKYVRGVGGKSVPRPEILYRDDPEMLARELAARERKFNVAPAYNKGGDVFVTEEELANQLKGNKRRP